MIFFGGNPPKNELKGHMNMFNLLCRGKHDLVEQMTIGL
uniref:Uncharacterized protein n=1 Tax=Arundo donax TaxID=35708 RepID=A0A0A9ALH0_ARUDO